MLSWFSSVCPFPLLSLFYDSVLCFWSNRFGLFFPERFCSLVEYLALGILPALGLPLPLWLLEDRNQYFLWKTNFVFLLTLFVYAPPPLIFSKTGKKAVKAVLWVSADGLRVVDEKTKVKVLWVQMLLLLWFFLISSDKMALSCCSSPVISHHVSRVQSFERLFPCPGN